MWNDTPASNFAIEDVMPLYNVEDPERLEAVELQVHAPDGRYTLIADVGAPIVPQITATAKTCRLLNTGASRAIDAHIIELASTKEHAEGKLLLRNSGLQKIKSHWVFLAGSEILGDCGGVPTAIHPDIAGIRLACDESVDSSEAVRRVLRAIERHPRTIGPTFCYTLLSSMRSQLTPLGLTTFPVLFLVGPQNFGKTRLASNYSLIYDDVRDVGGVGEYLQYGLLSFRSSDKALMRSLSCYRDLVMQIDDNAKCTDVTLQKHNQQIVEEIVPFAANGQLRQTAAKDSSASQRCQVGVVLTSEVQALVVPSQITRTLEVPLKQPMTDGQASDRADAAAAFRAWMTWLLPHFDDELGQLKSQLSQLPGGEDARLCTTGILFNWTIELFYRFALEVGITDREYYESTLRLFENVFRELLDAQKKRVIRIEDVAPQGNLSYYILRAYHNNEFHVVSSRKQMTEDDCCIVENGALCIRTETLLLCLQKQTCFRALEDKGMDKTLKKEWKDALGDKFQERAEKRSASKRIHGKRYLPLYFDVLKAAAKEY